MKKQDTDRLTWRRILIFDLLLLLLLFLATRSAAFFHEGLGHALTTAVSGGTVRGIHLTLLGGGKVFWHFDATPPLHAVLLVAFGGILVNLISGLALLGQTGHARTRPLRALFMVLFGMVSLLGAIAYSALGFYYGEGDPALWMRGQHTFARYLWIPFLGVTPLASFFAVRSFLRVSEQWFPAGTFILRVRNVILTLGLTLCAYGALYAFTDQQSTAMDTPRLAYQRAEREIREIKAAQLQRIMALAHPEWTQSEIQHRIRLIPIVVDPHEIPWSFPLKPLLAAGFLLGALAALRHGEKSGLRPLNIHYRGAPAVILLAGAVLAVLVLSGGWIYRAG